MKSMKCPSNPEMGKWSNVFSAVTFKKKKKTTLKELLSLFSGSEFLSMQANSWHNVFMSVEVGTSYFIFYVFNGVYLMWIWTGWWKRFLMTDIQGWLVWDLTDLSVELTSSDTCVLCDFVYSASIDLLRLLWALVSPSLLGRRYHPAKEQWHGAERSDIFCVGIQFVIKKKKKAVTLR